MGNASAPFGQAVGLGRAGRRCGDGGVEGEVRVHGEAMEAEIVDGLPGPAPQVLVGMGGPVQVRSVGEGLELLVL
ncbi:hypothetical protein ACFCYM_13815 [Streptomyces sp. NPDC056254]|uniref:hypothetical protein n=1 Tax=Streptomyces sp. NPDC056254 TaxID=3345763 RepID=UPI0035DD6A85